MNQVAEAFRPVVVIPVFEHGDAVVSVVNSISKQGLQCILVDDGSGPGCAAVLDNLAGNVLGVSLVRRHANGGKGAAVLSGLEAAAAAGFTHAVQIDADGQHDARDIPVFLDAAAGRPASVVCGLPVFDASIPGHRFVLRYLTHSFVWLNTLSLEIRDSMCGFRVYPVAILLSLCRDEPPGLRMDFDIEVLVRLHWRGVALTWIPTAVRYQIDGVSHFRLFLDNILISWLHARLFLGMLRRLPHLLLRKAGASYAT